MGDGTFPNMDKRVYDRIGRKYIMIELPNETIKRKAVSRDSLLYVAASLYKEFVHLPGFNDQCLRVSTLPNDILKAKVMMYKIDSPKTFTAIIAGAGYAIWNADAFEEKHKKEE